MLSRFFREIDSPISAQEEEQQQGPSTGALIAGALAKDLMSPVGSGRQVQRQGQSGNDLLGDVLGPVGNSQQQQEQETGAVARAVEGFVRDSMLPINLTVDPSGHVANTNSDRPSVLQAIGIVTAPKITGHIIQEGANATLGLWGDLNTPLPGRPVSAEEAAMINARREARAEALRNAGQAVGNAALNVAKGAGRLAVAGIGAAAAFAKDKMAEKRNTRVRHQATSSASQMVITVKPKD